MEPVKVIQIVEVVHQHLIVTGIQIHLPLIVTIIQEVQHM